MLEEQPQVVQIVKGRGSKRCLVTAFGDKTWTLQRTSDGDVASLVLPPLRLSQDYDRTGHSAREDCNDKGKGAADEGGETQDARPGFPCATLLMSMRAKKKTCMYDGSSMHNSVTLQRELSQFTMLPDDVDVETMFSVGECSSTHTLGCAGYGDT